MASVDFLLNRDRIQLSDDAVRQAVRYVEPGTIQTWSVVVNGTPYPVKQVLRAALNRTDFTSQRAADLLRRLGFDVSDGGDGGPGIDGTGGAEEGESGAAAVDDTRRAALEAAVGYASGRPDLNIAGVLAAADAFDAWLRAGTVRPCATGEISDAGTA